MSDERLCPHCGGRLRPGAAVAFAQGGGLVRVAPDHSAARCLDCARDRGPIRDTFSATGRAFKSERLDPDPDLLFLECERCRERPPAFIVWIDDDGWESAFACGECIEDLTDHGCPDAPVLPGEQRALA